MAIYLDPKNDLIFKRIFGEHPELLISFLNALMPFEPDRFIEEVEYLPAEQVPDNPGKKNSIVDVKCIDNYKRQFIIEMQMDWDEIFMNRIVFNAGKAYVRQLKRGDMYHLLHPVYTLSILNDNFDEKTTQFYHHYQIVNRANTDEIIPGLEFILVELPKFQPQSINDRKMSVLWLRFLKEVNEDMKTLPPEMQENKYISQAAELCQEAAFTPKELAAYDKYWDIIRTEKSLRASAMRQGEAKGEARGEAKAKIETAKNAIKMGISIDDIIKLTGLSKQQIEKLKK
jgi:predicted transposase/invertase (TIGR01784 family)